MQIRVVLVRQQSLYMRSCTGIVTRLFQCLCELVCIREILRLNSECGRQRLNRLLLPASAKIKFSQSMVRLKALRMPHNRRAQAVFCRTARRRICRRSAICVMRTFRLQSDSFAGESLTRAQC